MSDIYKLRVVKTRGFDEQGAEELLSIQLPGLGIGQPEPENVYTHEAKTFLANHEIYPWRVRDERVWTGTGAAAEFHEVVIFLAGAGAAAFTGALGKRLADVVESAGKKLVGVGEIDDGSALHLAMISHRDYAEYGQLTEMVRKEDGNRLFRFNDGISIELDRRGAVVRVEGQLAGDSDARSGRDPPRA